MISFTKQGLSWSNQQVALRSKDFFLIVSCVCIPLLLTFFYLDYLEAFSQLSSLPEVHEILASNDQMITAKVMVGLFVFMSYFALFASVCKSHWMMEKYAFIQALLTAVLTGFAIYICIRFFVFNRISTFGYKSYFAMNWTNI